MGGRAGQRFQQKKPPSATPLGIANSPTVTLLDILGPGFPASCVLLPVFSSLHLLFYLSESSRHGLSLFHAVFLHFVVPPERSH